MSSLRLISLTALAMLAFAANSVLCRLALKNTGIDAATFTTVRLVSGALTLWLIIHFFSATKNGNSGSWRSALALFAYAAAFSFAYITLSTGTGALLLFGAVQITMIMAGLWAGERLGFWQIGGLAMALGGLTYLVLPGLSAPPLGGAGLMVAAGIAWGIYSLRGRGSTNPLAETGGNFLRAAPMAIALSLLLLSRARPDGPGMAYAALSGAIASGVGYAIWYAALPGLRATSAATVQLSVPVIAAVGGIVFLGESVTIRLVVSSAAVLGGIALVLWKGRRRSSTPAR